MSRNAGGDPLSHGKGAQMPRFQSEAKCEAFDLEMIFYILI